MASHFFKEVTVHAKSAFYACLWSYAGAGYGSSCRGPGKCGARKAPARQQLSRKSIITPIDRPESSRTLRKIWNWTAEQQQQVRPLLGQHHDRIQALRFAGGLGPQIHAISDETHREIHALLTDHQKQLEETMELHGR